MPAPESDVGEHISKLKWSKKGESNQDIYNDELNKKIEQMLDILKELKELDNKMKESQDTLHRCEGKLETKNSDPMGAVSYTHLTLPTS